MSLSNCAENQQAKHLAEISCFMTPYKGIFTSVFLIRTEQGALLFDAASDDSDIRDMVLPWLTEQGITSEQLKYVFISHKHADHAGGLPALLEAFPDLCVVSQSASLQDKYSVSRFLLPQDGEMLLGCLRVVSIPGHTIDSAALLDTRSRTLICGDCLQLYGIFGEGKWGANIPYPTEHRSAIARLREMEIEGILAAHHYHPLGRIYRGREEISAALDACLAPLDRMEALIAAHPDMTDEEVCALYNDAPMTPTLGAHVIKAMRRAMNEKNV